MRMATWLVSSPVWLVVCCVVGGTAAAQVPDTTQDRPATIIGQVVDTSGAGVADADVVVMTGADTVVRAMTSDSQGNFKVRNLPAGGPYTLLARKMGYKPARGANFHVKSGDTLQLRFELSPLVVVLAPITVKGRRRHRSSLYADEFAKKVKIYRDALNLMTWYRPDMLGDPEFCSPPDSFGRPKLDRIRLRLTERLMLYTGNSQGGQRHRLWLRELRYGGSMSEPDLPYVRQVYVNGLRVNRPHDPIRTPLRMLRAIPSEHIAEMHYIDCWNTSMPVGMQYAIYITLKPLTPAQQDSLFGYVLAQAAAAGPVEGKVVSFERPSRELWDSIVNFLTGRDTLAVEAAKHDSTARQSVVRDSMRVPTSP